MSAPRIVMMGVSGCGKTTLARLLAEALGLRFVEGDALHSAANVQRMAAGIALTDADRQGWLQAVAAELARRDDPPRGVVASCSALKRSYRDLLRASAPDARFVLLHGDAAELARRLADRRDHYMPPSLLQSQLQTLEWPLADEQAIALDIDLTPEQQLAEVLRQLPSLATTDTTTPSRRDPTDALRSTGGLATP